jgi:phosphatidylglycerol lysyltransferase
MSVEAASSIATTPSVAQDPLKRPRSDIAVSAIAALTFANGLLNIYSVIGSDLAGRVEILGGFLPLAMVHHSRSLVLFSGFALVLLSFNVLRRKRRAWIGVTALSSASVVLHLTKGIDYEEALVPLCLLVLLWFVRSAFTVRSRDINWRAAAVKVAVVAVLASGYGVLGFWLLEPREFGRNFNLWQSAAHALQALSLDGEGLRARTAYARWFLESLDLIAFGSVLYAGWSLFRPVVYRFRTHPAEAREARAIVEMHGRTGQDVFKYSLDKSFFFSEDRSAFLAYRVSAAFAVVLADPVGPVEKIEPLVRAFVAYCRANGWRVAFHQATAQFLPFYVRSGLRRIKVGDDAIVQLDQFTLSGKQAKPLRSKLNQLEKLGIQLTLYPAPVPDDVLDQAQSVSDEWLRIPGRRERQFTLGRFDRDYLRHTEILAAEDETGHMLAFLNFVPSYQRGEATLDLMRRRTDGPNGIMDCLFVGAFRIARERGYSRFNLGMAPMSGFLPHEQPTAEERAIHAFFQKLNLGFSFHGLREYKAKFATLWEPRYVLYRSALDLPLLPLALGRISQLPEEE